MPAGGEPLLRPSGSRRKINTALRGILRRVLGGGKGEMAVGMWEMEKMTAGLGGGKGEMAVGMWEMEKMTSGLGGGK